MPTPRPTQPYEPNTIPNSGSQWHRWEPHIHAPGTIINDQFGGVDSWDNYLTALERADPPIRALGVTDYYLTHTYERVVKEKLAGRLPSIDLIFLNLELRVGIGTTKAGWVNLHLLVSPEDPEHLAKAKAFLSKIRFEGYDESFACTREDLVRLGKAADPKITKDTLALSHGAGQFKVSLEQLKDGFNRSKWARDNILVAVAGGKDDGTSGVREAADATLRIELEKFADVVFASSVAQREFWLGLRETASPEELAKSYGGTKPCLHGSDSHTLKTVGIPDNGRFSWIKGGLEFDALRQACIDPAGRAFVGNSPPRSGAPSQLIDQIVLTDAPWAKTPRIAFNQGLVAVIGSRGSGKTALADIIALACDAIQPTDAAEASTRPSPSFLSRAGDLLGDSGVTATWRAGDPTSRKLDGRDQPNVTYPRARYLSQQFVEELCSANTMTDGLLREIERVIFESHGLTDREGALDFRELLDLKSARFRLAREREEEAIVTLSDRISSEYEQDRQVATLTQDIDTKTKLVAQTTEDRGKLAAKGSEDRMVRLNSLTAAAEIVRGNLRFFNKKNAALLALSDEVSNLRDVKAPEMLRSTQETHKDSQMNGDDWNPFRGYMTKGTGFFK